jgi:hypothetical protein
VDRRYAFGVFRDAQGKDRLGIERHYHDGPRGGVMLTWGGGYRVSESKSLLLDSIE